MSVAATPKMDERECTRCHVTKPLDQEHFTRVGGNRYTNGIGRDGSFQYTKICNDCTRLKQQATLFEKARKRDEYWAWHAAQDASEKVGGESDIAQRRNIDP